MLTSLANVKSYLGITADTYDDELTRLISVATKFIQRLTGRSLESATYTQTHRLDELIIFLQEYPVDSITSIVDEDGNEITSDSYTLFESEAVIELDADITRYSLEDYKKLTITYVAGYSTIPADLEQAAIDYVKQLFVDRKDNTNLSSEKLGDYSYQRMQGGTVNSAGFSQTISAYKKIDANMFG